MRSNTYLVLLAVLVIPPAQAHETDGLKSIKHFSADRVTKNIYVVHGPRGLPDRNNAGFMNNPAFIITPGGVVVVDPGGSAQIGEDLVKKIHAVTDKPVIAIFNTHIHGDHWLGNDGIRRVYPNVPIYAHPQMVERINHGEGEEWIKSFNQLTEDVTAGTRVVGPTMGVRDGKRLNLGGMHFRIHMPAKAHTDTDIMIEVETDQALFLGDVVTHHSVPAVRPQDSSFQGYLAAFRTLARTPVKTFIPGHGPTGDRKLVEDAQRFLEKLYNTVTKYYHQGLQDFEMNDLIMRDLSEYRNWHWFSRIGRVISHIYREVEIDDIRQTTLRGPHSWNRTTGISVPIRASCSLSTPPPVGEFPRPSCRGGQ